MPKEKAPGNLVDKWTDLLKSNKYVALLILLGAITAGVSGFIKAFEEIHDRLQEAGDSVKPPELISFTLSPNAVGYVESRQALFATGPDIRTFDSRLQHAEAIFQFTVKNPRNNLILIKRAEYDVISVGEVRGGDESGPISSLHLYQHTIEHRAGSQGKDLAPVFKIGAHDTASFEIQLFSREPGFGLEWQLKIKFITDAGDFTTEEFQVVLPAANASDAGPIHPPNDLQSEKDMTPPVKTRDCFFRSAGIQAELSGMDQMELDILYMRATDASPEKFAKEYPNIPSKNRKKLQAIIKAGVLCSD